jgi:hypothetical protein
MRLRSLCRGFVVVVGLAVAAVCAGGSGAQSVRVLKAELSGADAAHFSVENLVGTMRISAGTGSSVEIVATVSAESQELADAVRLERVSGDGGAATLRVRYPYAKVSTLRYRDPSDRSTGFDFGNLSASSYDYDGHRVRVSSGRGTWVHADVEIHVPAGRREAAFRNLVGRLEADGLQGRLRFEVASADLRLSRLDGDVALEGSSGDVRARDIKGSWKSNFSSGDTDLDGFDGDLLSFKTSSGDVVLRSLRARRAEFESSSGDVRLVDADIEELSAEATSGDVALDATGARLKSVQVRTSSGDVALRLPAGAAFEVDADQSSGAMEVGFDDGTAVRRHDAIIGYRRGSGGAHIRVKTSSGDLSVSPG